MRHRHDLPCSAIGLCIAWLAATAAAAPVPDAVAADFRPLLYAAEGAKKILEFAKDGSVAWECPAEMSRDAWKLPDGNVLFPGGNVFVCNAGGKVPFFEVTREKKVAWQCDPAKTPIPLGHGVQRLDIPGTPVR